MIFPECRMQIPRILKICLDALDLNHRHHLHTSINILFYICKLFYAEYTEFESYTLFRHHYNEHLRQTISEISLNDICYKHLEDLREVDTIIFIRKYHWELIAETSSSLKKEME